MLTKGGTFEQEGRLPPLCAEFEIWLNKRLFKKETLILRRVLLDGKRGETGPRAGGHLSNFKRRIQQILPSA